MQGRINLSGQSLHRFGAASTYLTVNTDDLFSRRGLNIYFSHFSHSSMTISPLPGGGACNVVGPRSCTCTLCTLDNPALRSWDNKF